MIPPPLILGIARRDLPLRELFLWIPPELIDAYPDKHEALLAELKKLAKSWKLRQADHPPYFLQISLSFKARKHDDIEAKLIALFERIYAITVQFLHQPPPEPVTPIHRRPPPHRKQGRWPDGTVEPCDPCA